MDKSNKFVGIVLLQIIATFGVMNGHFLMDVNPNILNQIRSMPIRSTLLSYLYMGDFCVPIFFVLGGGLIPLSSSGKELSIRKCIEKWSSLMIPAIILTVMCFAGFSFAKYYLGELIPEIIPTTFVQCLDDILIYLTGSTHIIPKEFKYIPYYLGQLWFLFFFFKKWLVAWAVHHICNNWGGIKAYVLLISLVCLIDFEYIDVLVGLLCGEIVLLYGENNINPILKYLVLFLCLSFAPIVYNTPIYGSVIGKLILSALFGITLIILSNIRAIPYGTDIIMKLGSITRGIYYVHYPILYVSAFVYRLKPIVGLILPNYFVTVIMVIFAALLFQKYVFSNVNRGTKKFLDRFIGNS